MTIATRIKKELFDAEKNYIEKRDAYKAKYPFGVSFCFKDVDANAASDAVWLKEAEGRLGGLSFLVTPRLPSDKHDEAVRSIFAAYDNAETDEQIEAAFGAYCTLYTIR